MAPMASYSGPVRILDTNGVLLTLGSADLDFDAERASWGGMLRVIAHSGVAGKALHVRIEVPGGGSSEAALDPHSESDGVAFSEVAGIGPPPF